MAAQLLQPTTRAINWPALFETALLGGTGALMLSKALRGVLIFYIHPRYTPLVIACGIVLLLIAGTRVSAIFSTTPEPLRGRKLNYILLLLPVLFGTLVPARPLGSGSLDASEINAGWVGAQTDLADDSQQWNLLQWATALSTRDGLTGKPADVVGFVFHDPTRPLNGFVVARYVLTCCTADSNGVGLPVVWPNGTALKADSWVRVQGTLGNVEIDGRSEPALIATSVEPVAQPAPPYLYP